MIVTIIAFTIVLGVLIFFHELGHFLLAKGNGVGVLKFSLGFGPAIFKKRLGETEYILAAVPLGGYVKMLGDDSQDDEEASHIDPERSFTDKSLGAKASIVAAGPVFNLILAVVIYTVISWVGIPVFPPVIGEVQEGSPAYNAGIISGDEITSIKDTPVETWDDIALIMKETSQGEKINLVVKRNDTLIDMRLVPEIKQDKNIFGEDITRPVIGVIRTNETVIRTLGPLEGIGYGFTQSWRIIKLTGIAFWKMINGTVDVKKSLGGPIMIADVSGQTFKAGLLPFLSLIAFISINLAIINLLPIPILDGGFLLFFLIEALTGKPVEGRPREIAQQIGLFLLLLLMLFAFYNDIARLIAGH